MILPLLRGVPVLEHDQLPGRADEPERKANLDEAGYSANEPIVHAYGGDLVTVGVLVYGVPDLDSIEQHVGGHYRGGVWEFRYVANDKVRGAV